MTCIAMLGYGTVGSGVAELILKNKNRLRKNIKDELILSNVLVRNLEKHKESDNINILTKDIEDIFRGNVDIVVEAMGGVNPAYEYVKRALQLKKHVVTANKDLIAEHGGELLDIANKNGVVLRFEASVGGGIPILKSLSECLVGNNIKGIKAILNGTTNFILSKMSKENMSYEEALKLAQDMGFAEANPESDVMGYDAARKLSILSTMAFEEKVNWKNIKINGITDIDTVDFQYAQGEGFEIKLLAIGEYQDNSIYASVSPVMVRKNSTLGRIENEYNAILIDGDAVGDVVFTGKGAGMFPTASAVFSDIVDIIQNKKEKGILFDYNEASVDTLWRKENKWLLRVNTRNRVDAMAGLSELFPYCKIITKGMYGLEDEVAAFVKSENEAVLDRNIETLREKIDCNNIKKMMMLED
ncbi:homoserine dehydrogenase [Clostridium sp. CX1]|uniref:Homoserine dehydrogenase n=1 Tax=Clostridium tanneri TaxID=3037988 RepID=A0ABU4JRV3_9CLOT|nr:MULTISPECIES: homoserine dehydrogenase [unclassified Clostridium]MCT8977767.1 homoserine dehydrogenase [Clostridium sp. CX1]MDW8800874.1 homoserine dehydrogenase [Clostridium sp. A1-XYC3]